MEKIVIAAASYYNKMYYFNPDFFAVPPEIRTEIRTSIVHASDESKGIFSVGFYEDGALFFETGGVEDDETYSEIEGKMQIIQLEKELSEIISRIALWYKLKNGGEVEK